MFVKTSTIEAAKQLQVPLSTLKSWADRFNVGDRSSSGRLNFKPDDLAMLELIKSLRDSDCGFDTITRRISTSECQAVPGSSQTLADSDEHTPPIDLEALTERITAAVTSTIKADTEQAEKYARATHQIGALESEIKFLRQQLAERDNKIALLESPPQKKPWWRRSLF